MAVPYQRAILIGIMRTCASNPYVGIKSLEMAPHVGDSSGGGVGAASTRSGTGSGGGGGSGTVGPIESFTVAREAVQRAQHSYTEDERRDLEELKVLAGISAMNYEEIAEVCKVMSVESVFYN